MLKKYLTLAFMGATAVTVTSCNAQDAGFKKTTTGLEYKIVKDAAGIQKPAIGDYVEFHIKSYIRTGNKDSVLFDSREVNKGMPVPFQVTPPGYNGDIAEGFMMLTKGDSAVFRVPVDSLLKMPGAQAMPWMTPGKGQKLIYTVSMTDVKTQQQMQTDMQEKAAKQGGVDEASIKDYLAKNNIQATRTASGLYYKIDKKGTGPLPQSGEKVTMNYTGKLLDGTPFDSNIDPQFGHVSPFEFALGQRQVIPGWDEGIALMPVGTKGTLYIPSPMAYGPNGQGPIPANAVLIFDVEVVGSKKP